jgi:drug/metabolite transporter (DMT)-like permease
VTAPFALGAALVCTALGQITYKRYFQRRCWPLLAAAFATFAAAQIGFFVALKELAVGVVYMSMGLTQVLVLALSHYVLREAVTRHHLVAVALIVGGLVLYAS